MPGLFIPGLLQGSSYQGYFKAEKFTFQISNRGRVVMVVVVGGGGGLKQS